MKKEPFFIQSIYKSNVVFWGIPRHTHIDKTMRMQSKHILYFSIASFYIIKINIVWDFFLDLDMCRIEIRWHLGNILCGGVEPDTLAEWAILF